MYIYILANVSKVTVYFEPKFESVTWVPIFPSLKLKVRVQEYDQVGT